MRRRHRRLVWIDLGDKPCFMKKLSKADTKRWQREVRNKLFFMHRGKRYLRYILFYTSVYDAKMFPSEWVDMDREVLEVARKAMRTREGEMNFLVHTTFQVGPQFKPSEMSVYGNS